MKREWTKLREMNENDQKIFANCTNDKKHSYCTSQWNKLDKRVANLKLFVIFLHEITNHLVIVELDHGTC